MYTTSKFHVKRITIYLLEVLSPYLYSNYRISTHNLLKVIRYLSLSGQWEVVLAG